MYIRLVPLIIILVLYFSQNLAAQTGKPQYIIRTEQGGEFLGEITIELFPLIAPLHSAYFDSLVNIKFFDTTAFHRVVPDFVIQGGDPNSRHGDPETWGEGDSTQSTIPAEFSGVSHLRGIVGAARDVDINSASSQFYINVADNSFLDWDYTAYGQVLEGMDIADSIANAPRDLNTERPNDKIEMFITKGNFTNEPIVAPELLSPDSGAGGILINDSLKWGSVEGAVMYTIQISENENFDPIYIEREVGKNHYRIDQLELGNMHYYWRVESNNGGNKSEYSDSYDFFSSIKAPVLISPEMSADSLSLTPKFTWHTVDGAVAYRLQISRSPQFQDRYIVYDNDKIYDTVHVSTQLEEKKSHYWRVYSIADGYQGPGSEFRRFVTMEITSVLSAGKVPTEYGLEQNFPNPFNPTTTINYSIAKSKKGNGQNVKVNIYDAVGKLVKTLINAEQSAGYYSVIFEADNLSSGIYYYQLLLENFTTSRKMILLK